jgi:mRNA interferase HigB
VRVISKAAITAFSQSHPDALAPLLHWYYVAKRATWTNLAKVREDFPHADSVEHFTVFNIGGNKYRLISAIKYGWRVVYVRQILTHVEYDKDNWK